MESREENYDEDRGLEMPLRVEAPDDEGEEDYAEDASLDGRSHCHPDEG